MTPLLELRNVSKVYTKGLVRKSATTALHNVSLTLNQGEPTIMTVAGESGSGKTTLAMLLLGFITPTEGQILYKGKEISRLSGEEKLAYRREVQAVFQDPFAVFNPFYTVDHLLSVPIESFMPQFADWRYDWLDVPAMIRAADTAYVYPMVDRDPVPRWVDGRVALIGDAAHPMYPTGSNGASQAILDTRVLGAALLAHGVGPAALQAYEAALREPLSQLVLRNRDAGPFGLLNLVDDRCGGIFEDREAVLPRAEAHAFMARYQAAAGLAIEQLNGAPPTIAPGARVLNGR